MNIRGKRVLLRAVEERDNPLLLHMINDGDMEAVLGGWSFPVSESQQKKWFEGLDYRTDVLRCMVEAEGEAIGTAVLTDIDTKNGTAEVHIKLGEKACRGKGLGTEAVSLLTEYAFKELRLNCIWALVLEENTASRKMFDKCGFQEEGLLKERIYKNGAYKNLVSFSKCRQEKQNERNRK